jgi:hypothetical protein
MMSCCRSTVKGIPRKYRATTNPYGPGHNQVKFRFRLPGKDGLIIWDSRDDQGELEPPRVAVRSSLQENRVLLDADPGYRARILAAARNDAERKAWDLGSWDIVAGGMFDDVWDPRYNVVPFFSVPTSWRLDRSFDWGSSKPFSVGWWAESDGSDLVLPPAQVLKLGRVLQQARVMSTVRGDLFRWREWYGWNKKPNEGSRMLAVDIAKGIVERELQWNVRGRVKIGVADSAIFKVENGMSIATDMGKQVRVNGQLYSGVQWEPSDKSPGSRKVGWERTREMIRDVRGEVVKDERGEPILLANGMERRLPRERPGLFVTDACEHFLRTVPVLPRDDKDLDDVDTEAEDHVGDETRYRVRRVGNRAGSGRTSGLG